MAIESSQPIQPNQRIPSVKIKQAAPGGGREVDPAELFAGKKVIMFSLPGAFTPTCSAKHLPGYLEKYDELRSKGIDLIACLSVNDAHVMQAWAEQQNVGEKIAMLADGSATFTRALGIDYEPAGMGFRARRGVFLIEDGVVKTADIEQPGKFDVSGATVCLARL
jgi:peroxiredoxin (alkyl hydroperoxide reductase subunit C)